MSGVSPALQPVPTIVLAIVPTVPNRHRYLTDEYGNILLDENGNPLTE